MVVVACEKREAGQVVVGLAADCLELPPGCAEQWSCLLSACPCPD